MTRISTLARAAALIALLGAAACGGDTPTATNTTPPLTTEPPSDTGNGVPDACTLFTSAELEAALGTDPGVGTTGQVVASRSVCTYESGATVGISESNQYEATVDAGESAEYTYEEVTGVGEKAVFTVVLDTIAQMLSVQGEFMIDINIALIDDDREATKQVLAELSTQAYAKLG